MNRILALNSTDLVNPVNPVQGFRIMFRQQMTTQNRFQPSNAFAGSGNSACFLMKQNQDRPQSNRSMQMNSVRPQTCFQHQGQQTAEASANS